MTDLGKSFDSQRQKTFSFSLSGFKRIKSFRKITLILVFNKKNHAKILNFEIKIWGKVLKFLERTMEKLRFLEEIFTPAKNWFFETQNSSIKKNIILGSIR